MIAVTKLAAGVILLASLTFCRNVDSQRPEPYIKPRCQSLPITTLSENDGAVTSKEIQVPGDLVNTQSAAIQIGNAILLGFYRGALPKYTVGVTASDAGQTWRILEKKQPNMEGGGASFNIDKCSGEVTNFAFSPE
jgi:hypothetical protein